MREGHSLPVWPILVSSFGKPCMAKRQTFLTTHNSDPGAARPEPGSDCAAPRRVAHVGAAGVDAAGRSVSILHVVLSRPSNTVAAISPNKPYHLIKQVVVSIVGVVSHMSDFRL